VAQAELLPFLRIVESIKQLCVQRRSGTVFLVSDDNRMAQVHLENGEIASLLCRNRRGLEALGIMRGMQQARLRFDESYIAKAEKDNLSTQAIFDDLFGVASNAPVAPRESAAPAAAPPSAPVQQRLALSADVKATFQRVLTAYIGPMAEIVCEDHFDQAGNLRALVQLLAGEIAAPDQAAKFRDEIARELSLTL
jgi:hypothetical protein